MNNLLPLQLVNYWLIMVLLTIFQPETKRNLVRIDFYGLPLHSEFFYSQSAKDIVKNPHSRHIVIQDKIKLFQVDSTIKNFSNCLGCDGTVSAFNKAKASIDVRQVFILTYSDSICVYIGLSINPKIMKINDIIYKRNTAITNELHSKL